MSDVQDLMLSRFLTLYGEPKTDNLEAFFDEYERALRGMARDILSAAADRVIKATDGRWWPTPGECVKACNVEAERMALDRERFVPKNLDKASEGWAAPSEESKARCRALVAALKREIGGEIIQKTSFNGVDRNAWNARRGAGVSRHGDPIRKSGG
jgi:hypothetical protein